MNIDTNTVTIIIAVIAIISPILTTLINNMFQLTHKKIDDKNSQYEKQIEHQQLIIENYLRNAAQHVNSSANMHKDSYKEAYAVVLFHVPSNLASAITEIDILASCNRREEANNKLTALIPHLKNYVEFLKLTDKQ